MQGIVESSINTFCPSNILVGPYGVHSRALETAIVPTTKDNVQKLYNAAALIALIKDAIVAGRITFSGSHIHTLPDVTTILQARIPSAKMDSSKKILGTSPLSKVHPHISVAISVISIIKDFTPGMLCFNTGASISFVSKKWCNVHGLKVKLMLRFTITLESGKLLDIIETPSMMVIQALPLKVDLGYVTVSSGDLGGV